MLRRHERCGWIEDTHVRQALRAAELVPAEFLAGFLKSSFADEKDTSSHTILLDGFPRRRDQIEPIQQVVSAQ